MICPSSFRIPLPVPLGETLLKKGHPPNEQLTDMGVQFESQKALGRYKGRQPIDVDKAQFEQKYKLWKSGQITATAAMSHLG